MGVRANLISVEEVQASYSISDHREILEKRSKCTVPIPKTVTGKDVRMRLMYAPFDVLSVEVELPIDILDTAVEVIGCIDPLVLVFERCAESDTI